MDIAKKPTPIPVPLYPDPNAPKVPTGLQGPNEQSIVASGMTVEEWQRKHPRTPLGPAPEDVGQVTTDPPDGSDLEPPYPGTGTTADPELMSLEKDAPIEDLEPVGSTSVDVEPVPVPEEPKSYPEIVEETEDTGDLPSNPDQETEGAENEDEDGTPWDSMGRHADIDAYVEEQDIPLPPDWQTMTIQEKRDYLDKCEVLMAYGAQKAPPFEKKGKGKSKSKTKPKGKGAAMPDDDKKKLPPWLSKGK